MRVMEWRSRRLALVAAVAVLLGLVLVGMPFPGRADAALGGLTQFAIDGDTVGPTDWDALPANLLEHQYVADACGNGVLDPDQLDGKLEDLDLDAPAPAPGNVIGKGDVCRVWRAVEAVPDASGSFDIVLYGAWERFTNNGEVTGYWPLVGPAPGKDDDVLVEFDATASGGGTARALRWDGSSWAGVGAAPVGTTQVAFDDPDAPLFGEFAINLSAAGLWPTDGDCTAYASDFVFTRTGNSGSAELQDFVGLAPAPLTQCASLVVRKVTTPAEPDPAQVFGYALARQGGEDVVDGDTQVTGSLTVPGAAQDTVKDVISANDYLLTEPSPPPGWTVEAITCDVADPATGARSSVEVTTGDTFPVAPGYTTVCTITNSGPATLTIVKATVPQAASQTFAFTGTRPGGDPVTPFTLSDGTSHQIPVTPGDTLTIAEAATADWTLQTLDCVGDDEVVTDPVSGTATVSIDPGEQVVCTFVNADNGRDPARAYLVVEKVVPEPDGTGFDFTVRGPLTDSRFTLAPPIPARHLEVLDPAVDGSTYTVAEIVPAKWHLHSATCRSTGGSVDTPGRSGAIAVVMLPNQVTYCRFTDVPVPPPARLTIVKTTTPAGAGPFDFTTDALDPGRFSLGDGQSRIFDDLAAGSYQVTEDVPAGWLATGTCDDGTRVRGSRIDVDLEPGDDVTCTFRNIQRVSLTVTKDAAPDSTQDFTFSVSLDRAAAVRFALDDDGTETDDPEAAQLVSTISGHALVPGLYTVTESPTEGWQLADLDCTGGQVLEDDPATATAIVRLTAGQSAQCVYRNEQVVTPGTSTPPPTTPPTQTSHPVPSSPRDPSALGPGSLSQTGPAGLLPILAAGLVLVLAGFCLTMAGRRWNGQHR